MSDADAFLAAIRADPTDDAPRLVFADWLDEHGQPDRAELLRVQCEKARLYDDAHRRRQLLKRERAILAEHARRWLGPVHDWAYRWRYERGFPVVTMNAGTFLAVTVERGAAAAFRAAGLAHLRLTGTLEQIEAIARSPLLAQMHTLDLDGNHLSDRGLAILLTSPHLQQLHTLNLANNYLSEAGFYDLLDARLPKLRWLDFRTNLLGQVSAGLFPELRPEDWPFAADLDGNAEVGHLGATPPGMLVNSLGMRFVPIPAGFDRTGQPVGPFWMGVYPVTLGDYDAVFREFEDGAGLRLPMEDVAYRKGEELCSELTQFNEERATGRIYDLPSVNEWQYACAADTTTAYGFGPAAGEDDLHCGSDFPLPVGRYPPNAWGLYDMHGTIEELCRQTEPPGVALCGGSYRSSEDECQTLSVRAWSAEESAYGVGFRVVLRQPPPSG